MLGFWLFYDPFFMIALFTAYVVGFIFLQFVAMKIAPRVAAKVSGRFSLYTSMLLTAFLVLGGGIIAVYAIYNAALQAGVLIPLEFMIGFVIIANIFSYIMAPWLINAAYSAKPDPELQRLVDEAAVSLGVKPPRAVSVEGPPNAFAYGNILSGRYVAVTDSLRNMLSREELLAVIGHELGHHKHRDMVILLLLGIVPSVLYYMGIMLIHTGLWGGGRRSERGGGAIYLAALGVLSIMLSLVMQIIVLAFSRLREYYADTVGARTAGSRPMQRALAKIHLYYHSQPHVAEKLGESKVKTLFIYAFTEAVANPFYPTTRGWRTASFRNIDRIVEELKMEKVDPSQEVMSSHPPIPKRLRFLDSLEAQEARKIKIE